MGHQQWRQAYQCGNFDIRRRMPAEAARLGEGPTLTPGDVVRVRSRRHSVKR